MAEERAYAKVNLTLDILRRRPDGYHDMRMVMQSISLCDTLSVEPKAGRDIQLDTNLSFLPCDRSNIVQKAAAAFFTETGIAPAGYRVSLHKRIPVCAGTGGGSSDGAAMLRYLRRTLAPELPDGELLRIAALVGSDVPFCLFGGTALAEGRGELLQPAAPLPKCAFLLCKPDFPISTPELFAQVRAHRLRYHPDTVGMLRALAEGDLPGVCRRLYNVFEDILPRKYQKVWELKRQLMDCGAMGASMTGSGPTVFGIYAGRMEAEEAAGEMGKICRFVAVAEPVSSEEIRRAAGERGDAQPAF